MNQSNSIEQEPPIRVTKHAMKRFKQRLGLPKSAHKKSALRAYKDGLADDHARGKAKLFLRKLASNNNKNILRVYGEFVYIFDETTLVTVFGIPRGIRKDFFQ
ncbi:MAG: Unknown protein [uncultured Thiotrichaceae bacterium]|uniref:Uncharacterized protein n=1 Tax=uncultured Thiotrichaceae bacterium TaxID=298394 RepID=A0A6S6SDB0_9GAMM|nr:MAG: Unknown protein [uncultured Thiotrichaceae bacterium]